jgi:hypothetical protein
MAWIELVTYPAGVIPQGTQGKLSKVDLRPALWVLASAFVYRRPWDPLRFSSILQESGLLLSSVHHRRGVPLRWTGLGMASPPHLSRFLTESLGLAVSLEMATRYGWSPHFPLVNLDEIRDPALKDILCPPPARSAPVLITSRRGNALYHPRPAARPDYVFITSYGLMAAEARGRSHLVANAPSPDQQRRCADMEAWQARVPLPNLGWFMSWTGITEGDTVVHFFDPGEPWPLEEHQIISLSHVNSDRESQMFHSAAEEGYPAIEVAGRGVHVGSIEVHNAGDEAEYGQEWLHLFVANTPWLSTPRETPEEPGYFREISIQGVMIARRMACVITRSEARPLLGDLAAILGTFVEGETQVEG